MRRLAPRFVERVWGSTDLSPLFASRPEKIGEVWFDAGPLLIKFLFTTAPLSVQVHPDDAYAAKYENSRGKTEMWHVLRVGPEGWIALGFDRPRTRDEVAPALLDGSVEGMMRRVQPRPGETYFVPAGVVHALGPDLVVCEIQQSSDVTYRLYDYNRGRELHVARGLDVARLEPHDSVTPPGVDGRIAGCSYFVTERRTVAGRGEAAPGVWIALEGSGSIGGEPFEPGAVFELDAVGSIESPASIWLRTFAPA